MSAAPLWAGNDLVNMSSQTQQVLTNREVIAVDQDPLGQPGTLVLQEQPGLQVWARPLEGNHSPQAVLLFNRNAQAAKMQVQWEDLGIYGSAAVRDLWSHHDLGIFPKGYEAQVPAHGVVMLRVDPQPGN
jgi:alpha-galactosidase